MQYSRRCLLPDVNLFNTWGSLKNPYLISCNSILGLLKMQNNVRAKAACPTYPSQCRLLSLHCCCRHGNVGMRFWLIEHIEHEDLPNCLFHGARETVRERSISGKRNIEQSHCAQKAECVAAVNALGVTQGICRKILPVIDVKVRGVVKKTATLNPSQAFGCFMMALMSICVQEATSDEGDSS